MATTVPGVVKRGSASADDETRAIIYEGANMAQLCLLFKLDHRTLVRKLFEGNCKPIGKRAQGEIYLVHEVAPWLVKPAFDVEAYIKKMDHRELPKHLTKEFWSGLRSKQEYEEKKGLLWRTETVIEKVGELMKLVKMSALLMLDAVERQTELTERQRDIIRRLTHGMLDDLSKQVIEKFKAPAEDVKRQETESEQDL